MKGIFVYGAGGHGKVVIDTWRSLPSSPPIDFLVDDDVRLQGRTLLGIPVRGPEAIRDERGVIAIGDNTARIAVASRFKGRLVTVIHRSAVVSSEATVGEGTMIMPMAVVNPGAVLGENVILNTGATVDHDCVIEDGAHIAPGVHLCGNVMVGEGALLGVGVSVVPGVRIGKRVLVHAGMTVRRDVADDETLSYRRETRFGAEAR